MGAPGIGWAALFDDDMLASGLKIQTATPLGIAYQTAAMTGWSSLGFLSGLKALPTLVLAGEQDGVMPACYGQMLADQIDGAVLEVVPGSHLFPFTHAADISARISAFLDSSTSGQQAAA
jgi:pimeloyl-ACP methyl ester carboxylesterase